MAESRGRWVLVLRHLCQPPRPHGEQPVERSVSPLELFYDLIVVVLVGQAAHQLAAHTTWRGLADFAAVFMLVWIAWVNGSLYHDLHGREDARSRTVLLVQILALVPLGAYIPRAGDADSIAFPVGAAVLFAVLAVVWFLAGRHSAPQYRRSGLVFVAGTAGCAVVLGLTAPLSADARLVVWSALDAVYLAGFGVLLTRSATRLIVTPALIERFSLFIIIVLGETVVGVVDGLGSERAEALTIAVGLIAVVVGFGAWWTYFDFVGNRPPRTTRGATAQWILVHAPLTAAVAAMGAAMPGLVEHAHASRTPVPTAWLMCTAVALVLLTAMAMAASLELWRAKRGLYLLLTRTCVAVGVLALALAAAHPAPLPLGLGLVLVLSIPWTVAVVRKLSDADADADAAEGQPLSAPDDSARSASADGEPGSAV